MQHPAANHNTQSRVRLFREDVVRNTVTGRLCLVVRSWNDLDDIPVPTHLQPDPSFRPLTNGEVNVVDLNSSKREIIHESDCVLVERYFRLGDAVKRSSSRPDDPISGVVLEHKSELALRHVISNLSPNLDFVPEEDVELATNISLGDLVICGNWLGQIEEIFEEIEGETNGQPVRIHDTGSRFQLGRPTEISRSIRPDSHPDLVLAIHPRVLCIAWLAINQALPPDEATMSERPDRFWQETQLAELTLFRRSTDCIPHVSDRVRFRTDEIAARYEAPITHHPRESPTSEPIIVQAMTVAATRTSIKVLWQDGRIEELRSFDLIPHHNLDDLDCWPGDFVQWTGDESGQMRAAVVQSLDPMDRTAIVRWFPVTANNNQEQTAVVSCLELDPHGKVPEEGYEVFGVQRGDIAFIHPPSQTNGSIAPCVPKIGELESWVHAQSHQEWRDAMLQIGKHVAEIPTQHRPSGNPTQRYDCQGTPIRWVGEVIGLLLNGEVKVRFPDGVNEIVPVDRLTILNDFADEFPPFDDAMLDGYVNEFPEGFPYDASVVAAFGLDGIWQLQEGPGAHVEHEAWKHLDETAGDALLDFDSGGSVSAPPSESHHSIQNPPSAIAAPSSTDSHLSATSGSNTPLPESRFATEHGWRSFVVLPSAQNDHAFISQTPATQPTKAFLQRLSKEYKVLSSSLPEDILVRAYEDRTDLLRCLIIGSAGTPYEDAPFVIDWFLPPNFPHEPPKAHFHSWTHGNGRVNPNLYEDGKVCLSILNTWEGERSESWSAARSSLLQAFISIQGLVLVKEPYFCEPAFERMRGTEEGSVNSCLYSERVYVMTRSFIKHALQNPPSGLEAEVRWLYFTQGKLGKVIADSTALITLSKDAVGPGSNLVSDERAINRLTLGGILTLGRTLSHLQNILDSERDYVTPV